VRLLPLACAAALSAALLVPLTATPAAAADAPVGDCLDHQYAEATPNYDDRFSASVAAPSATALDRFIPQGLDTWESYYGAGKDLLVYTAYHEDDAGKSDGDEDYRGLLQGVDPADGSHTNIVRIPPSHAGGVAVHRTGIYISDTGGHVRRYDRQNVADVFSGRRSDNTLNGTRVGPLYGVSFLAVAGDTLFAGRFDRDDRQYMYRYSISDSGALTRYGDRIQVPKRAQGLLVLPDYFVFSSSFTRTERGNLYVLRRGYGETLEGSANWECVRTPEMGEGITLSNDRVYHLFESGASHYANGEDGGGEADTKIRRLQVASRTAVLSLLGER
jgi:hypothetical protein